MSKTVTEFDCHKNLKSGGQFFNRAPIHTEQVGQVGALTELSINVIQSRHHA